MPWAERRSHFTLLFERLAIAWLKEATPLAVARRLGLTWEEANGIVERAVRRGLARRTSVAGRRLGIDEHSYLKHFQFVTMVVDLDTQHVLHVADDRTAETLGHYFAGPTPEERAGITAIASGAFFLYATRLQSAHVGVLDTRSIGPLLAIIVLGMCVGFLPFNFNPARIFMGDCGALLLGVLMAASTSVS